MNFWFSETLKTCEFSKGANFDENYDRCYGGVFVRQVMNKKPYLKEWHLEAMKITQTLVEKHEVDMMDFLGYLYPYQSQLVKDGLHWSSAAHRLEISPLIAFQVQSYH